MIIKCAQIFILYEVMSDLLVYLMTVIEFSFSELQL